MDVFRCKYAIQVNSMEKVRVYCLPYAGGNACIYNSWKDKYVEIADIVPMEYNGHNSLFHKPFYKDAHDAASDLCKRISNDCPDNYIIFGHSMGALITYLTAVQLEQKYMILPKAILIGGSRPPHLNNRNKKILHLPKQQFMNKIFEMGQTESDVMNEPELVDLLYDVFYTDIKLIEEYKLSTFSPKLKIPIVVMTGTEDVEAPREDMREWMQYTEDKFYYKEFNAGHFFPFMSEDFHDYLADMLLKINADIL